MMGTQDSSLAPFPTRRKGFWLSGHCCPAVLRRFIPAGSGSCALPWALPEGGPICFTVGSPAGTVWRGYGAIKSWRKRVMMNARVLKANRRTDSSSPVTLGLTIAYHLQQFHDIVASFMHLGHSCYCPPYSMFVKFKIRCKIPNHF